jgi:anti-sigma factor RsiW
MRFLYRVRFTRDHAWAPDHMSELLDGELAPGARSRMERHLGDCPECERLLAGLRAVVQGLGHLPGPAGGTDAARIAALVRGRLDEPPAAS